MPFKMKNERLVLSVDIPVTPEEMSAFVGHFQEFVTKCDCDGPVTHEDFLNHLLEGSDVFAYDDRKMPLRKVARKRYDDRQMTQAELELVEDYWDEKEGRPERG